jgi:membrane-anchored protein YejM (alkaline phosphatase superfamily)
MAQIAHEGARATADVETRGGYWAFRLLHAGFVALPLIAGIDKFFYFLTEWQMYLSPIFPQAFGVSPELFMRGVGVVEILAALLVLIRPRDGAYVVAVWLGSIVLNLAINPANTSHAPAARMWDVALGDFGLMLGALALAWLSADRNVQTEKSPD